MKTRKTSIQLMAALLMAGAAFTSCSNDDNLIESTTQPAETAGKYILTVEATKGFDASATRALDLVDATLLATWSAGDEVSVYNASDELLGTLTATPDADDAHNCTFSGALDTAPAVGDALTLKFNNPYYGNQDGTLAGIATLCDYAEASVTVSSVDTEAKTITASQANFVNQQAIAKFTLMLPTGGPVSATALKVANGSTYVNVTPEAASDELFVAIPGMTSGRLSIMAYDGNKYYRFSKEGVTLVDGKYYTATVPMDAVQAPDDAKAVDLGLDSGTKWANMNVGATSPTDYGTYFAWGEVMGYTSDTDYDKYAFNKNFGDYSWCNSRVDAMTKYCSNSGYGYNGFTDEKTELDAMDDAAVANWGGSWHIPTKDQIDELCATKENTNDYAWTWCDGSTTQYNGSMVKGWKIEVLKEGSAKGNTLFLPTAGARYDSYVEYLGREGAYSSAALHWRFSENVWGLYVGSSYTVVGEGGRYTGQSVRAVQSVIN